MKQVFLLFSGHLVVVENSAATAAAAAVAGGAAVPEDDGHFVTVVVVVALKVGTGQATHVPTFLPQPPHALHTQTHVYTTRRWILTPNPHDKGRQLNRRR
jgi:hypothetical protein